MLARCAVHPSQPSADTLFVRTAMTCEWYVMLHQETELAGDEMLERVDRRDGMLGFGGRKMGLSHASRMGMASDPYSRRRWCVMWMVEKTKEDRSQGRISLGDRGVESISDRPCLFVPSGPWRSLNQRAGDEPLNFPQSRLCTTNAP